MYIKNKKLNSQLLADKKLLTILFILSVIIYLVPIIFISEEIIKESKLLNNYIDFIMAFFPQIDKYIYEVFFDDYYSLRLEWSWKFLSFFLLFIFAFIYIILTYLINLEYIRFNTKYFYNKNIKEFSTNVKLIKYLKILMVYILAILLTSLSFKTSKFDYELIRTEFTLIGSFVSAVLFPVFYSLLTSFILLEGLAHLRKIMISYLSKIRSN